MPAPRLRWSPGGLFVAAWVGLMRWLSPPGQARLAAFIAWFGWTVGIRRRVTLENLARAFPDRGDAERRAIARAAYRNMALAAIEAVSADRRSEAELAAAVSVTDWKGLDALLAARRPVLIASAHFGSWELFAEVMARRGVAFSAVVRPLSGAFNEWIVHNREAAGVRLIPERGALRGALRALEQGRAVVQLIDQALPAREAVWVPFFGRPASTTPALSMAALRSGAPVYVVLAERVGRGLHMRVEGPFPVATDLPRREAIARHVEALTLVIERAVRRAPEQWLWLHRRWKGAPPQIDRRSSTPA